MHRDSGNTLQRLRKALLGQVERVAGRKKEGDGCKGPKRGGDDGEDGGKGRKLLTVVVA